MDRLTQRIKECATKAGAALVGIARRDRLEDAPPSGDPTYRLPSARSVISFAVALNPDTARDFIAKRDWTGHGNDRKASVKRLYTIGEALVDRLRQEQFEAVNVEINNTYRPEDGAADITQMTEFYPDFSHRYAAVAAGVGRLGWSGNLMTPEHGALVELGSVLTSAELAPDPPLADNPCDRCLSCTLVCPVKMMSARDPLEVKVAGITEVIAEKRPNTCCWIGCTGYEGRAAGGAWSNWSPYRLDDPLPEEKSALDALCIRLQKADPQMQQSDNYFKDYRAAVSDPAWFYYVVCGFCRSVCLPDREDRLKSRKELHRSGVAVLRPDGMHDVAAGETVMVQTPYEVKVEVLEEDLERFGKESRSPGDPPGRWPLDREVLAWLARREIRDED